MPAVSSLCRQPGSGIISCSSASSSAFAYCPCNRVQQSSAPCLFLQWSYTETTIGTTQQCPRLRGKEMPRLNVTRAVPPPQSHMMVPGRTTQGNYTRGCERQCSAGTFPRGRWARTRRQAGRLDHKSSRRFGYCWRKARRCHVPVWATAAEHQHPVSNEPCGAASPGVGSDTHRQKYIPTKGCPAQPEGKRIKAKAPCKQNPLEPGLFQVLSAKAPAGTLPAAMPVPARPGDMWQRCLHQVAQTVPAQRTRAGAGSGTDTEILP